MILENELLNARGLKTLVLETSSKVEAEYYLNTQDALDAMKEEVFDVFIVRVSSAKDDEGIRFAKILRQIKIYEMAFIVFVISNKDAGIRNIIQDEFYSYWVLPTPIDKFLEAKLKKTLSLFLAHKTSEEKEKDFITMVNDEGEKRINFSDILFVDIVGKVVTINLVDGTIDKYPHGYYSLKQMIMMLGDSFIQIFRSIIVNKEYVKEIDYEMGTLKLEGIERPFRLGGVKFITGIQSCFGDNKRKEGMK